MAFAPVNGINLYYETHGREDAQPLLLINGLGGTCQDWGPLLPTLSQHFFVVIYDNRGAGKSDKPDPPYSMEMLTADVIAILDRLGLESIGVFGISMGGMIAQLLALEHPRRTQKIVLGCTSCSGLTMLCKRAQRSTDLLKLLKPLPHHPQEKEEAVRERLPFIFSQTFIESHPQEINSFISKTLNSDQPIQGYLGQLLAILGHDLCTQLSQITVPTLVLHGTADNLVPLEEGLILAERIPQARFIAFEGAGHLFYLEQEEKVSSVLARFVGSTEAFHAS